MEVFFHKAGSVSPDSWASGIGFAAFLPHQEPPIHNHRSPTHWDPSPPTLARSKTRPGMPRWGQAGVTRAAVPRGGAWEDARLDYG